MNKQQNLKNAVNNLHLIEKALDGLRKSTGINGYLIGGIKTDNTKLSFEVAGRSLEYVFEVKEHIDRFVTLDDMSARFGKNRSTLLISQLLTNSMAERCYKLGIQFIDTAGNAYLCDEAGLLINIAGRTLKSQSSAIPRDSTITPTALRMMFAFLAKPLMLNMPYREISKSIQISVGAIGPIFDMLETKKFIHTTPSGNRSIQAPELMLSEWATGYINRLRPKLKKFRFATPESIDIRTQWSPGFQVSAWGGEIAAEILTNHLKPATATIYMDVENNAEDLSTLVKRLKLRSDLHGSIEIIQPFWNMDFFTESFPTVPPHLVYADLIGTQDSRNLLVARQIAAKFIDHVHNP